MLESIDKKQNLLDLIKRYTLLIFGILIATIGFNLFFLQFNLVCFGVSGFSIIIEKLFQTDPALFILIASLILLILSFFLLGWNKTKNSIVGSLLFPLFVKLTYGVTELINLDNIEMILIAIFGGIFSGFGYGLIYKTGFTTGGTDILNQIISKYFKISIGKSIIIIESIVVLTGFFVFGTQIAMLGIVVLYIMSLITDKVILGISESKSFHIITSKQEKIQRYLVDNIGAGVTILEGHGGFSGGAKKVLMCIVPTRQYFLVKQRIQEIDETAFFVITDAYEVNNLKKRKIKHEKI